MKTSFAGGRFVFVMGLLAAGTLLLLWKLASLMILTPRTDFDSAAVPPRIERGPILDRNGRVLAITTRQQSAHFWKPEVQDPEKTARYLATALHMDEEDILRKLSQNRGFIWIKRKISDTEAQAVEQLREEGNLPGVYLAPEFGRSYPERELACHVIGFVDVDNRGRDGIEASFNTALSPETLGQGVREVYGNQVFLTLDINIQYFCERIARRAYRELSADSLMLLVMEAKTGEILAYVSLPEFDPNQPGRASERARFNRPARMIYEPGSVFKIFSISSFLQAGGIRPSDTFQAPGYYELPGGQRITDLGSYGTIDVAQIIKFSSNVGAAKASETVDRRTFYHSLLAFGFGRKTGVAFAAENPGHLRSPERWSSRSKATLAFGQEISVTALQMLSAATVLANDGIRLRPLIVKKVVSPDGRVIKNYPPEVISDREVLSPEVARTMLDMMEGATHEGGTARRARIDGLRISAKTGTAQVARPEGGYYEDRTIASFLGILPTGNPRLIVYVVLENPKAPYPYGGILAAPIFRETVLELIRYLDIPTAADTVITHSGTVTVNRPAPVTIGSRMPDLRGVSKRMLMPLLAREDLRILIVGEGYVVNQSPPPGTPITPATRIRLELQ